MRKPNDEQFTIFGKLVWRFIRTNPDFLGDPLGEEFMTYAERWGLCERASYNPEVHGDIEWAEPGSEVWVWWTGNEEPIEGDNVKSSDGL